MAEGSSGRSILGGLVGPTARPKGVADGQTVDIPSPRADAKVRQRDGVGRAERGAGDAASNAVGASRGRWEGSGRPEPIRSAPAPQKSRWREAARARTANRHRWPGVRAPRGTGDPSSRN
jgi:hypothetical protein